MPGRKNNRLQSQLETLAKRVLKKLRVPSARNSSVDIVLLPGRELGRLKARFGMQNKAKKPDVLAFPEPKNFPNPESAGKKMLGEIFLNRDLARDDFAHLNFLLIHGILHLLGLSHDRKSDTLKMEKLEQKLMRTLFPAIKKQSSDRK